MPSDPAETGRADHDADHHAGAERAVRAHVGVAQQERHEHQQEAAEEPRAAVGAQRERHRARDPGPQPAAPRGAALTGRARTARPRPRWSRPPAGSRIAQTVAMTNSSGRVAQRPLRAGHGRERGDGCRHRGADDAGQRDPAVGLDQREVAGEQAGYGGGPRDAVRLGRDQHAERGGEDQRGAAGDRRRQRPAQEGADRHRRADRPAPAVREPVEERADQRRHDRERQHREAEEQRDLVARLARGHLEEQAAGQRDRHRGVAGGVEDVHLDQPVQAGLAGALGLRGAAGLDHGELAGPSRPTPQRAQPAAGRLGPAGEPATRPCGPGRQPRRTAGRPAPPEGARPSSAAGPRPRPHPAYGLPQPDTTPADG